MKPTYAIMLLAFVLVACNSLKTLGEVQLNTPTLGAIGKEEKSLIGKKFQQVGQPLLSHAVALSVYEIPFTKSTYKEYSHLRMEGGNAVTTVFIDSIKEKPKYLRLGIDNKIGLTAQLNADGNEGVRSYLEKDADCRIVSDISIYLTQTARKDLLNAKEVFLGSNHNGTLQIELVNGTERKSISLPKDEIFDYGLSGFCWGENIYGNARIETMNEGGGCPEGTVKRAQKLEEHKSYLKL